MPMMAIMIISTPDVNGVVLDDHTTAADDYDHPGLFGIRACRSGQRMDDLARIVAVILLGRHYVMAS